MRSLRLPFVYLVVVATAIFGLIATQPHARAVASNRTHTPPRPARPLRPPVRTSPSLPPATASPIATPSAPRTVTLPDGRSYVLTVAQRGPELRPLLVVLGGYAMTAAVTDRMTHWSAYAAAHDMSLVYGVGVGSSWNAGGCCGKAAATGVDDVGYLRDVIFDVQDHALVDASRIYVVGFSNGGMMAETAACELPDIVAAAGVGRRRVAAARADLLADRRHPRRPGHHGPRRGGLLDVHQDDVPPGGADGRVRAGQWQRVRPDGAAHDGTPLAAGE